MSKKRKAKLRIDRVIICALILILLVGGLVMLIRHLTGADQKSDPSAISNTDATVGPDEITDGDSYIQIEQDDCTLLVGSSMQLTVHAVPEELASSISYSVTDENVVMVDDNGFVTVVGEGTGAVVCVAGIYSDSIIIEGISEKESISEDDDGNPEQNGTKENAAGESKDSDDGQQSDHTDKNSDSSSKDNNGSNSDSTGKTDSEQQTTSLVTDTQQTKTTADTKETSSPTTQKQEETTAADPQTTLNAAADQNGFTPYTDGTYVYREDDNYLGEAIVGESMTQIYVKTRTSGFDNALKNFLSTVLPTGYETAFVRMTTATSTATLTLDGHRVRIVVSTEAEESHRQMIIYY